MIPQFLADFFHTNGFVFELIICNILFASAQEKRRTFGLRLLLASLVMIGSAPLLNLYEQFSPLYNLFKYSVWFFISFTGNLFIYSITAKDSFFISIAAMICQHMSFKVGEIVLFFLPTANTLLRSATYLAIIVLMYLFALLVFARRYKQLNMQNAKQYQLTTLYLGVAIYVTVLQYQFTKYIHTITPELYLITATLDILCCLFAMMLQFGIIETATLKEDSKLMEHILHMQSEKYLMSKETIELINIKFHDIKKQLTNLSMMDDADQKALYQTLSIYDMSIKSGSEALDIVLAEKSLLCEQQHILLECMADGERLAFMNPTDVYSLIGNAIDNAIESVLKVSDVKSRFINISIRESHDLIIIRIENPYEGTLLFQDGLPLTTKEDKNFHGFGMKSIQKVVEKYNGYLSVNPQNQLFVLNIVLMGPKDVSRQTN